MQTSVTKTFFEGLLSNVLWEKFEGWILSHIILYYWILFFKDTIQMHYYSFSYFPPPPSSFPIASIGYLLKDETYSAVSSSAQSELDGQTQYYWLVQGYN